MGGRTKGKFKGDGELMGGGLGWVSSAGVGYWGQSENYNKKAQKNTNYNSWR